MPDARTKAEEAVPADSPSGTGRESVVEAVADDLRTAAAKPDVGFIQCYVDIPCPSGKHQRSMLKFRGYNVGLLFCLPCEECWKEPITHPALRDIAVD